MIVVDEYLVDKANVQPWIPYPGNYHKKGCDIRLANGEEWGTCYPNAGKFLVLTAPGKQQIEFDESEVTHIRYYERLVEL